MYQLWNSMLWNDKYKFDMQQAALALYPEAKAEIQFFNRGTNSFPAGFATQLQEQINYMAQVKLTEEEANYLLTKYNHYSPEYVEWLRNYRFDPEEVRVHQTPNNQLYISIVGPWVRTMMWEIPLLKIISELYNKGRSWDRKDVAEIAARKAKMIKDSGIAMTEGGTRRAFSETVHRLVFRQFRLHGGKTFLGTSNMQLAMEDGSKAYGSVAHEWPMFHAAIFGVENANNKAFTSFADFYSRSETILSPKTCLTDTYTTKFCMENMPQNLAARYNLWRPDSGDPYEGGHTVIRGLWELGINPAVNTLIFGDALNVPKAIKLQDYFRVFGGGVNTFFCIGTDFTNDIGNKDSVLNMVFKPVAFSNPLHSPYSDEVIHEWHKVAKISDSPGKYSGSIEAIEEAKRVIGI